MKPSSTSGVDSSLPRKVPPVERPPIEKMNLSLRSLTSSRLTSLSAEWRNCCSRDDDEPILRLVGGVEQALRSDVGGERRHRHGHDRDRCNAADKPLADDLPPLRFFDRERDLAAIVERQSSRNATLARPEIEPPDAPDASGPHLGQQRPAGGDITLGNMLALAGPALYKARHLSHADLALPSVAPSRRGGELTVRGGFNRRTLWRYPTTPCVSFWKLAYTSAIRPIAGIRRWLITSSASRNNIHIIDLQQSVPMLHRALQRSATRSQGRAHPVVGTKRQAQDSIADAAKVRPVLSQFALARRHAHQLETISQSINRLRKLDDMLGSARPGLHQEERLTLQASATSSTGRSAASRIWRAARPSCFVIDTEQGDIAIKEGQRLKHPGGAGSIPICDPDGITFPGPGNDGRQPRVSSLLRPDRARRLDGISRAQGDMGMIPAPPPSRLPEDCRPRPRSPGYEVLSGPVGVADDLKKLAHVSPTIEKQFNDLGIYTTGRSPLHARGRAPDRRRRSACRPHGELDRAGQGLSAE